MNSKRSDVFWDCEITRNRDLPRDEIVDDVWKGWPFGISVAAVRVEGVNLLYNMWGDFGPALYSINEKLDGQLFDQKAISVSRAHGLMDTLLGYQQEGRRVFAWNGVSFDWQLLARLTGRFQDARTGALNSYDPMFQGLCVAGFPVKLESVAMAFGYPGKPISGGNAPQLWEDGLHDVVCEYVQADTLMLQRVVHKAEQFGGLKWLSKKNSTLFTPFFPRELLTVEQCMGLPLPDTSWAKDDGGLTVTREQFIAWFDEEQT